MPKEPITKEQKEFLDECFKKALDPVKLLVFEEVSENTDFFDIMCKAELEQLVFKFMNFPMTIFKSTLENQPCITVLFQLPFKERSKKLSDKVIDLVKTVEYYLHVIDNIIYKSKRKDKFTYVVFMVKETEEVAKWVKDLL